MAMTNKERAANDLRIVLANLAKDSMASGESEKDFIDTLEAMRAQLGDKIMELRKDVPASEDLLFKAQLASVGRHIENTRRLREYAKACAIQITELKRMRIEEDIPGADAELRLAVERLLAIEYPELL